MKNFLYFLCFLLITSCSSIPTNTEDIVGLAKNKAKEKGIVSGKNLAGDKRDARQYKKSGGNKALQDDFNKLDGEKNCFRR